MPIHIASGSRKVFAFQGMQGMTVARARCFSSVWRLQVLAFLGTLAPFLLVNAGCANTVGPYFYVVSGDMISSEKDRPLSGADVAVSVDDWWAPSEGEEAQPCFERTDSRGHFSCTVAGRLWGRTFLFGFIPLGASSSSPPLVKEVHVRFRLPERKWSIVAVPTAIGQQGCIENGKRRISLGVIRVSEDANAIPP